MLYRRSLLQKSAFYLHNRYVNTLTALSTAFNSRPDSFHKSNLFSKQTVFDHLSNTLCKVADLAEFIRMAHPSISFSSAAESACVSIGSLVEKLNTNKALYDSLHEVVKNGDKVPTTEVDDHVAKLFLFDFEQSGIHLEEAKRIKFVELNERILTLGQKFLRGTLEPRAAPKDNFAMDGNNVVVGGMLADNAVELTREAAYKVYLYPDQDQEERLRALLRARHEMASLCGFPSFAHRAMRGSLAETPQLVQEFLTKLSESVRPEAETEICEMAEIKRNHCSSSRPLAPWDVSFLTGIARYHNMPKGITAETILPYLSLGTVMEGLNDLFIDLFNVSLKVEESLPGELWSNDVYKVGVYYNTTERLGYIYCDFFEHHRKANQDCHFTILGGKTLEDGTYQDPVVVLLLNLPNPTWSGPCLLSLPMMENLFHEMGHALHSMLARTHYQHVTGTRCSTDFAEVPSILMEYFANDSRVIHRFARHFQTNEKLPLDVIEKILASRYTFASTELQLQTFYAILDQRYHNGEILLKRHLNHGHFSRSAERTLQSSLRTEHGVAIEIWASRWLWCERGWHETSSRSPSVMGEGNPLKIWWPNFWVKM
ncbi:Mitochondrial intermediate peptidase [Armadillidium nasatum]|uniref:Mitochondrial intermediate peptidase n=1 Tax=Armadillidium nasatum TaxID=96803 RepID=A0A5N5SMI7_9CRUS|nr:Mitochondrial intermediate peptidase [Armadillidium nasatum]